jgi:hypothetical protein
MIGAVRLPVREDGRGIGQYGARLSTIACLLLWCTACGPDAADGDGADAAIPILEVVEAWRVDGMAADLVPIPTRNGIVPLSDGGIAVAQRQDYRVLIFDSQGGLRASIGSSGAGPGEFGHITEMGLVDENLWVWDARLGRMSIWDGEGLLHRTMALNLGRHTDPSTQDAFTAWGPRAVYGNNDVLVHGEAPGRAVTALALISADGMLRRVAVSVMGLEDNYVIRTERGVIEGNPFELNPLYAVSPNGLWIAVARIHMEGRLAGMFSLALMTANGDTIYERSLPFDPEPIPQTTVDSALVAGAAALDPSFRAAYMRNVYVPPYFPPLADIHLDRDGIVWVGFSPGQQERLFLVLDRNGSIMGYVRLPQGAQLATVDGMKIWATLRDSLGVQSVVKYAVLNGSPG